MRFLNLKYSSPATGSQEIEFHDGLNIISVKDTAVFNMLKHIPAAAIYSEEKGATSLIDKNFSWTLETVSDVSETNRCFTGSGSNDISSEINISAETETGEYSENTESLKKLRTYSLSDFFTCSYYDPESIHKNADPVFEKDKLKSLLISNEICRAGSPFFTDRNNILAENEKELTDLNREKQLLELKKMKKEKLLKEITLTERNIQRLEKRKESILNYKAALAEVIEKTDLKNKLLSRINNLKKDLIELKEIKEKIGSVENTLRERFFHFSEKGNEQIPDLEQIQESFNSFRDINEQLDKFFIYKKNYSGRALKITASMLIFSLTALLFMLFTSSASFILGATSGIGAGVSAIAGLIYFFRIRHLKPDELLEKKKSMENKLVDLLKKNNFSVEDYKTGELYEILFQYFEDFINYRDISYELMELKKKISNSSSLSEKEKKLRQLKDEIDDIDSFISTRFATMDKSIHPVPSQDNIEKTLFEIDDLLKENNTEIENKKTLIEKFEVEIDEYDKIENSSLSAGIKLEEILARIDKCREEKEHIKFLNRIFDEAAETWCTEKLEALSKTALEKFRAITGGTFAAEDAAEAIKSIILHPGRIKNEHRAIKKYISFSIKAALSETLFKCGLPPVFLINPFNEENEFSENMKKLLPELFSERQVVVLIPGDAPDIKGNLITL